MRLKKNDFPKVQAAEWITPRRRFYYLACCDCALVHKLEFRLVPSWHGPGQKIQMRAWRDKPRTQALRKREPPPMKFDPDKLTLEELTNIVFAKAAQQGVQLRMRFIYPRPAKVAKKPAKKKAVSRGA